MDQLTRRSYILTLIILIALLVIPGAVVYAQTDSCSTEEEHEMNQLLALAQTYERERAWDKASDTYAQVAASTCDSLAVQGREGLSRALPHQVNWSRQLMTNVSELGQSAVIALIQLFGALVIAIVLFFFGRSILRHIDARKTWTVLPFTDLTGKALGELVTESVVNTIHEARFIHTQAPIGLINVAEGSDLPSFSGMKQRDTFISALGGLDSFDVSGFGLPVGSVLASIARWLDLGGIHLEGSVRQFDNTVEITARLEEGRNSRCIKIWKESGIEAKDLKTSTTFHNLQEKLCYRILLDIMPDDWGTKSAEALLALTNGLKHLQQLDNKGNSLRNKKLVQKARDAFESAKQHDPTYHMAIYHLALAELNLGNNDRAIELLKGLEELL